MTRILPTVLLSALVLGLAPAGSAVAAPTSVSAPAEAGTSFVIPWYELDLDDPNSTNVLVAVRNEGLPATTVQVRVFTGLGTQILELTTFLGDHETRTYSIRDALLSSSPASSGRREGYIRVDATGPVSVDSFQVDTGNDFAVGGAAFAADDICRTVRLRFLRGGAFNGGTQIQYYTPEAYGGEASDPPTLSGVTYDEAGNQLSTFTLKTPRNSWSPQNLIPASATFGSMDLTFENPQGGYAWVTHDALGRFSVRVEGICLDSP